MAADRPKPITPYARVLRRVRTWSDEVRFAQRKTMWRYEKARLGDNWSMTALAARVAAADQLGWDVCLFVNPDGDLVVQYRKRPGEPPDEVLS